MKTTILKSVMAVLVALFTLNVHAYDFEVDGIYYNIISTNDMTCEITATANVVDIPDYYYASPGKKTPSAKSLYTGNFIVPEKVTFKGRTLSVIRIGDCAFYGSDISSIKIAQTIQKIGVHAFSGCNNLSSVESSNVTMLGPYAFSNCSHLSKVSFPKVTNCGSYDGYVFYNDLQLTTLDLPSVTFIGKGTFSGCDIANLAIEKVENLYGAYEGYLGKVIRIPSSCKSFSCDYGLGGNHNGAELIIEDSDEPLGIGGNIRNGDYVDYDKFKKIYIGRNIDKESWPVTCNLCRYTGSLKEIEFGNTVTYFGNFVRSSEFVETLILGEKLNLREISFADFKNLKKVIVKSATPIVIGTFEGYYGFTNTQYLNCNVYVPRGSLSAYQSAEGWKNFWNIEEYDYTDTTTPLQSYTLTYIVDGETYKTYKIQQGTTITPEAAPLKDGYTFSGWSGIPTTMPAKDVTVTGTFTANSVEYVDKASVEIDGIFYRLSAKSRSAEVIAGTTKYTGTVNIPATVQLNGAPYSVTSIGTIAFKDCSALTSVKIPEGITSIGIGAFLSCTSLSSVSLPNSITEIGNSVFWGCKGLESINIPSSVTTIGEFAFVEAGLTSLTIPSSVQSIQQHAFLGCKGLTNVTIPGSVVSIDEYAFSGCDNLSSITLENGVTNIGERVFMSCGNLETVVLPNSLEVIGPYAFAGCNQMRTMDMPNSVTTLGDGAFLQCANLETVKLSAGIKTMGTYIFQKCYNLNSVIIPGIKTLTEGMFMNCSNLIQVEMTEGVESLGLGVFYHCTNLPSITIPQSVKSIGQRVFEGCENLTSVTVLSNTPATLTSSSFENASKSVLYVPKGSQNTYQSAAYWKNFAMIVEPYYTLTYMIDDGVYKTVNVNYGESITPEAEPTKEGYTFSGWSEIPATMPAKDVTVTGSFTINKYTLTYRVDDETYMTYEVEYGADITPEAEPTKEGYTFSGWSWIPATMPAEDVVITGSFTFIDAINDVIADDDEYQIFTLDGKPVETLQKGVNIIRYSDGTTKSVYVK